MVLGVLDQLQIFLQLYLIELLGLLTGLGLLKLQHLIYPRHLAGFDILVFFTNVSLSGQIFGPISSISSFLWVVLDGKYSQEYPVNAGVPQGAILGLALCLLYIIDLPDDICNIASYADDILLSTPNVIRHLICGTN